MPKNFFLFIYIICVCYSINIYSQDEELLFDRAIDRSKINHYDFSHKYRPSIEVKVWGAVRNSGVYKITKGTNLLEVLSFTGGLTENAQLDDLRIVRLKNDTLNIQQDEIITVDYEAMFEKDNLNPASIKIPDLFNNDIIVIPQASTWFDDIRPVLNIVSVLSSLATLIYVILRLN